MSKEDITIAHLSLSHKDERSSMDRYIPIGTLYLVSSLEKAGFRVDFRDYQIYTFKHFETVDQQLEPDSFLAFIEDSADIVGVSCTSDLLPFTILAAERFKQKFPKKTLILGGIGPTGVAEHILRHFPYIDIVVKGEGEKTIVQLMDKLLKGDKEYSTIKGICYKKDERIVTTPVQDRIQNLDKIPFPAYDRIHFGDYNYVGIISTRGCPFHCTFCDSAPFWQRKYVVRSIENILTELEFLYRQYSLKQIEICDDLFFAKKSRCIEFCMQLLKRKLDIQWSCSARIDRMDEELMKLMAESGCHGIFYGLESGSDKVLAQLNKKITRERAKDIVELSTKYFDVVITSFMWGFPFESRVDFVETLDLLASVVDCGAMPWFFLLCPFPQSRLFQTYKDQLRFSEELCSNMIGAEKTENLVTLIKAYPDVFPGYYYYDSEGIETKYAIARQLGRPYLQQEEIQQIIHSAIEEYK